MRLWTGGYTAEMDGAAAGIGELRAGAADDVLAGGPLGFAGTVARTGGSPSWIAQHPSLDVVYAALEGAGAVQAFRRTGEASFAPHGAPVTAGDLVCHVAVAPDGGSVVASCWGDGRVVRMTTDAAGRLAAPIVAAPAVDPYAEAGIGLQATGVPAAAIDLAVAARALREAAGPEFAHLVPDHDRDLDAAADAHVDAGEAAPVEGDAASVRVSRAHEAVFLPGGLVATTDLGFDLVRIWRLSPGGLRLDHEVVLPSGCGPRHMVLHPSGHLYVVTEYSCEVFVLAAAPDGRWELRGGTSASPAAGEGDAAAELAASHDGGFLYAGLRGSDTIAVLRVRGAGESLDQVALVESGVHWPRHHVVLRDTLLVAGQRSSEVTSLGIDLRTGVPGRVRHRAEVPSPTCLLPVR